MRQASCARSPGNTRAATAKSVARRPWRATPSHWGRRKGERLRADPGARTKPGDVSLRLLGCLTSEDEACCPSGGVHVTDRIASCTVMPGHDDVARPNKPRSQHAG